MAKKIEFEFDGELYTLEYSRRTITTMERNGFILDQIGEKPQTMIPMLYQGAFLMHHPRIKEEQMNTIFKNLTEKDELLEELIECYRSTLEYLFDEPEEEEKKVKWRKA